MGFGAAAIGAGGVVQLAINAKAGRIVNSVFMVFSSN
jgi:hypothetical protein